MKMIQYFRTAEKDKKCFSLYGNYIDFNASFSPAVQKNKVSQIIRKDG